MGKRIFIIIKNLISHLNLNNKIIRLYIIMFFLIIIGLILWQFIPCLEEFGLSFFTGMIGVFITIAIVENILKSIDAEKTVPLRLAAYEEIRSYLGKYIDFWASAYRDSVPDNPPDTIQDLFTEIEMEKICQNLYLDSNKPSVIPKMKYWDWIAQSAERFKENGDKILDRYVNCLDPTAFRYIHQITDSGLILALRNILNMRKHYEDASVPRLPVLSTYAKPMKTNLDDINGLIQWCEQQYKLLLKIDPKIISVTKHYLVWDRVLTPKCKITESAIEKYQCEERVNKQKILKKFLRVREIRSDELNKMEEFIYLSMEQNNKNFSFSNDYYKASFCKTYYESFGKNDGDNCLVAIMNCEIVGMVWTSILSSKVKDDKCAVDNTLEINIAICKQYRRSGIGTRLIINMFDYLRKKGFNKVSVCVQKGNELVQWFVRMGFQILKKRESEFYMMANL